MNKKITFYNVGLPTIILVYPPIVLCFIPIVLIEAYILIKQLKLSIKKTFIASSKANIWTTVIGMPFAWIIGLFTKVNKASLYANIASYLFIFASLIALLLYEKYNLQQNLIFMKPMIIIGLTSVVIIIFIIAGTDFENE